MTILLNFVAVILLLLGIVLLVGKFFLPKNSSILHLFGYKSGLMVIISSIVLFVLSSSMFYAERGVYYEVISPTGSKSAIFDEGYHLVIPFTVINPWTANIDVKAGDVKKMSDEIEGKMLPVSITFIDQVGAMVSGAYRFTLPRDEKIFLDMAVKYRSISNLTDNTLIPTISEQAKLTAKMYTAQDYISGSSQSFRQTFEEHLKTGTYVVEKTENKDTSWTEITNKSDRRIKDISIRYTVEKILDENGLPKRIPNEISASGIIVSQVIIEDVDVDADYKERLIAQKAESATRQLEQQKIETAKIAQQRIKAEGERDKESERVNQEKNQVKELIAIETKLKQEKTNLELAKIQLETEKTNAQKKKVSADAQYYENAKMVSAGLTPLDKAKLENERVIGIAAENAKIKFPEIMIINGGNTNNTSPLESLIGAAMSKQLLQDIKK